MFDANGKQVLRDGRHYADAITNEAATEIADAMNRIYAPPVDDASQFDFFDHQENLPIEVIAAPRHFVRREGDEYVCCCGIRWAYDEGEEHP